MTHRTTLTIPAEVKDIANACRDIFGEGVKLHYVETHDAVQGDLKWRDIAAGALERKTVGP